MSLPRGMVTLLFTDLVGSSERWDREATSMRAALGRHDALLTTVISQQRGHLVKKLGDGVMAAFADPADAVTATVEAQRSLARQEWPDELRGMVVRMGVHTGYVELDADGDDLLGPTVNRAARIAAAAHGGQIVVSSATHELVGDRVDGISFRDLGEHRLRGITHPQRVLQVIAAGLETRFGPLRSEASPTNVPPPLTNIHGRTEELSVASRLLDERRLVTVAGAGGVGKTTLALEVGRRRRHLHPAGVWLVELAGLTDGRRVATECLGAMRQTAAADRDHVEVLVESLSGQQSLLILDNCEHLLADVAAVIRPVLERCADVTFLITSREALGVPGEQLWPLPTLSLPNAATPAAVEASDAGALFVARARAADPTFDLVDDNAGFVAELCERLDGLPLALELASARLRSMGIADLVRRLDDRFTLLTSAGASLSHHRTLRDTVAWSYELLGASEQRLYRRLSVFVGGFDLDAAEAVADDDVLDDLDHLVTQSLVQHRDGRYRMLETIRQYGVELLDEHVELDDARRAHLGWLEQLARTGAKQLEGAQQAAWQQRFQSEIDNIRAAFSWAVRNDPVRGATIAASLTRFFWMNSMETTARHGADARSYLAEGHEWASDLLDAAGTDLPAKTRARLQMGIGGMLCVRAGHYDEAVDRLADAMSLFEGIGDERGRGWARFYDGTAGWSLRSLGDTIHRLHGARAALHDVGDAGGETFSTCVLGYALVAADRADEGRPLIEDLRIRVDDMNVPTLSAHAADEIVLYDAWEDRVDQRTIDEAELALTLFRSLNNYACISHTLGAVAMMLGRAQDPESSGMVIGLATATRRRLNLVLAPYEDWSNEVLTVIEEAFDGTVDSTTSLHDRWQAAVSRGLTLDPDEGIDLVLHKLRSNPPGAAWTAA